MKSLKTFFALVVSVPFLYMPVELALKGRSSEVKTSFDEVHFESDLFGADEWMTSNLSLKSGDSQLIDELLTYEEVETLMPEGWSLPSKSEMEVFLAQLGFEGTPGFIPSDYYKFNWEYKGYEDPILGRSAQGAKMLIWVKDDGQNNYVVVDKDQLTYKFGRTLPNSQLSARLKRK